MVAPLAPVIAHHSSHTLYTTDSFSKHSPEGDIVSMWFSWVGCHEKDDTAAREAKKTMISETTNSKNISK